MHVFLTLDFPPSRGGVARYYWNLARTWTEPLIVVAPGSANSVPEKSGSAEIQRHTLLSSRSWPRWLPMFSVIRKLHKQSQITWLHVGQVLPVGTVALVCKKLLNIPYVVYVHGLDIYLPQRSWRKRILSGMILRNSSLIVANSGYTAKILRTYRVPESRILIATPGCTPLPMLEHSSSTDLLRSRLGLEGDGPVILTVARLMRRKGIDVVLKAVKQLSVQFSGIRYVIAGDGPEFASLQKIVGELGLAKQVVFVRDASDEDLKSLYSLCDVFVLTPREIPGQGDVEGFGIVYLEANLFEKPVIGSRTGGVPEAVLDGVTGLLVEPEDVGGLVHRLSVLLSDTRVAREMGKAGRSRVLKEFRWEDRSQQIIQRLRV